MAPRAPLNKPRALGEALEGSLRPGADMRDDFGGAQAAELAAGCEITVVRQSVEKSGGIEIAGAGGVDHARNRRRRDVPHVRLGHDVRAALATRQHGDVAVAAYRLGRELEMLGLVERADFALVGEEHVDVAIDQLAEIGAVAIDAKWIRQ